MFSYFDQLQTQLASAILIVSLVFYLLQTLFGYKLFRASCAFVGFIAGLLLGIFISSGFFHLSGAWPPIIGVLAGLLLGFLAYKLFLVGLFILVFLIAYKLAQLIPFPKEGYWDIASVVIAVALAVIAGILAVRYEKVVIIVITAVGGAINSVTTFTKMSNLLGDSKYSFWIACGAVALVGLLIQFLMNKDY